MEDTHPHRITRLDDTGSRVAMSIFEYLFVHAQRMSDKKDLRKINTNKWAKSKGEINETRKKEQTDELKKSAMKEESNSSMKLYQRGLGLFNKLVVTNGQVSCNCQNFRRFGRCEDSELIGFICLGKDGYPSDASVVDCIGCRTGYGAITKMLHEKMFTLVERQKDADDRMVLSAPRRDPTRFLQEVGNPSDEEKARTESKD